MKNVRRLIGVLLRRSEFAYTQGWCALGHNAEAEAATLMSILVDTGDHAVAPWLQYLTQAPTRAAVLSAASHRPTLLRIIEPAGAC